MLNKIFQSFFALAFTVSMALPMGALAAGFTNNELWVSPIEFNSGESTEVHAVLINDKYSEVSGIVEFFIDEEFIASYKIKDLKENDIKQIRFYWQPGSAAERTLKLRLKDIVATLAGETKNTVETTETTKVFTVSKDGEKLSISSVSSGSQEPAGNKEGGKFSDNKDALEEAQNMVSTITSTAAKVTETYNKTKEVVDKTKTVVEKGQGYYQTSKEYIGKVGEFLKKFEPTWLKLSNNNEPKRIVIIVVVVLVLYWLIKRSFRKSRYDRRYRD